MKKNSYLLYDGKVVTVKYMDNPHIRLALAIFGGEFQSKKTIIDNLPFYIDLLLRNLSSTESFILDKRFGISSGRAMTLEQVADEFKVSREHIRTLEAKALRKLRHPSRHTILKGRFFSNVRVNLEAMLYYDKQYKEDFIGILKRKIKKELLIYLKPANNSSLYLNNIIQKNQISIIHYNEKKLSDYVVIEELELTKKMYGICKSRGVNTLRELKEILPDLYEVFGVGEKSIQEVKIKINEFEELHKGTNRKNRVEILCNNTKEEYEYDEFDAEAISDFMYNTLFERPYVTSILEIPFSPGLTEMLIFKGYMYESDICLHADLIENMLVDVELSEYAKEIYIFKNYKQFEKVTRADDVYITSLISQDVIDVIEEKSGVTVENLVNIAKNYSDKRALEYAEIINS